MDNTHEFKEAYEKFYKAYSDALKVRIPILSLYVLTEYDSFGKQGCEFVYTTYFTSAEQIIEELKGWPNSIIAILDERLAADNITRFDKMGKKLKNKFEYYPGGALVRLRCVTNPARDNFIPVNEISCPHDSTPGYARAIDSFSKPDSWGDDDTTQLGFNILFQT